MHHAELGVLVKGNININIFAMRRRQSSTQDKVAAFVQQQIQSSNEQRQWTNDAVA